MCDIFLSYKSEDKETAQKIAEAIEQNGYSVFWDQNIEIGESWEDFIEEKLAATKCVVVLWSEKSIKSDWVKDEADEGKKKSILVQVLIDNVIPPMGFRRKQAANLVGWDGTSFYPEFVTLLKHFSKYLGPPHVDKTGILKEEEGLKEEKLTSKAKDTPVLNKTKYECMKKRMIEIPASEDKFTMGDDFEVIISHPFLIDKYLVTQDLYKEVMKKNPSYFSGEDDLPVEKVSWFDAIEFCNELSKQTGLECVYDDKDKKNVKIYYDKSGYRLPTEAEWEYACCRGTTEELYENLDDVAWYNNNSEKQTHRVEGKDAIFGLFDMLGNVWEWCNDWYEEYPKDLKEDPIGPKDGYKRSLRGGSWLNTSNMIRPGYRQRKDPFAHENTQGIRLVRSLNQHVAE